MTGNAEGRPAPACTAGVPRLVTTAQGESRGAWPTHAAPGCPGRNLGTKPGKESHRGAAPTRAIESRRRRLAGEEARGQEPATAATPGKALNGPRDETRTSTLFRNEGKSGSPSGGAVEGPDGTVRGNSLPGASRCWRRRRDGLLEVYVASNRLGKLPGVFSRMSLDYPGRPAQNRTDTPHPGTQMTDFVTFT